MNSIQEWLFPILVSEFCSAPFIIKNPEVTISIRAQSHNFMEIDHEIISRSFSSLPMNHHEGLLSVSSQNMCRNYWLIVVQACPVKVWLGELTDPP